MRHLKLFESHQKSSLVYLELVPQKFRFYNGSPHPSGRMSFDGIYEKSIIVHRGIVDLSDPVNSYAVNALEREFPVMLKFITQALQEIFGDPPYTKSQIFDQRLYNWNEGRVTELYNEYTGGNDMYKDYFSIYGSDSEITIGKAALQYNLLEFVYPRLSDNGKGDVIKFISEDWKGYREEQKSKILKILGPDAEELNSLILLVNMGLL